MTATVVSTTNTAGDLVIQEKETASGVLFRWWQDQCHYQLFWRQDATRLQFAIGDGQKWSEAFGLAEMWTLSEPSLHAAREMAARFVAGE